MFSNLVAASIINPASSHRSVARQVQFRIPKAASGDDQPDSAESAASDPTGSLMNATYPSGLNRDMQVS